MKDLAGVRDCDHEIEIELNRSRIEVVHHESIQPGEVPARLSGRLSPYTFERAWRYWVVKGNVPLSVAEELYADPVGHEDIRAMGFAENKDPRTAAQWVNQHGQPIFATSVLHDLEDQFGSDHQVTRYARANNIYVDDPSSVGVAVIMFYHIDSEIGLRLFADTLKKHGLV